MLMNIIIILIFLILVSAYIDDKLGKYVCVIRYLINKCIKTFRMVKCLNDDDSIKCNVIPKCNLTPKFNKTMEYPMSDVSLKDCEQILEMLELKLTPKSKFLKSNSRMSVNATEKEICSTNFCICNTTSKCYSVDQDATTKKNFPICFKCTIDPSINILQKVKSFTNTSVPYTCTSEICSCLKQSEQCKKNIKCNINRSESPEQLVSDYLCNENVEMVHNVQNKLNNIITNTCQIIDKFLRENHNKDETKPNIITPCNCGSCEYDKASCNNFVADIEPCKNSLSKISSKTSAKIDCKKSEINYNTEFEPQTRESYNESINKNLVESDNFYGDYNCTFESNMKKFICEKKYTQNVDTNQYDKLIIDQSILGNPTLNKPTLDKPSLGKPILGVSTLSKTIISKATLSKPILNKSGKKTNEMKPPKNKNVRKEMTTIQKLNPCFNKISLSSKINIERKTGTK